jgi:hypothetical protein
MLLIGFISLSCNTINRNFLYPYKWRWVPDWVLVLSSLSTAHHADDVRLQTALPALPHLFENGQG